MSSAFTTHIARFGIALFGTAALLAAQGAAPGFRLFGHIDQTDTYLVDRNDNVVHTWPSVYRPGVSVYLADDGALYRTIATITPPPGLLGGGGGLQRVALDGTVEWEIRFDSGGLYSHHDIEIMPNGNILMIIWEDVPAATAIANGRDPAMLDGPVFRPDRIVEIEPSGTSGATIVWEWRVMDHVIQDFDPTKANYGVVANHPELVDLNYQIDPTVAGDWTHINSIDYDPVNDWVILSAREQSEVWIIDHSTTTAQAAGHTGGARGKGGDILYRWGNPEAYRAGTSADRQLFFQHSAVIIPAGRPGAGNMLVFNNQSPPSSTVIEIELPVDGNGNFIFDALAGRYGPSAPIWSYSSFTFTSGFVSSCERLPNGNTLICSGVQGWIFEVNPASQIVWQHITNGRMVFHAHHVERSFWCDTDELSLSAGGVATMDMIAGSEYAGHIHLVLASASGTSPGLSVGGLNLPLNVDGLFMTTLSSPNVFPWANTAGILNANGRAQATFTLPGGILPPALVGLDFQHAFLTIDPLTGLGSFASNADGFTLSL